MKPEQSRQIIIARNVPQLVNLLLDSKEHVKYEECVKYGIYMLANYNRPPCSSESVLRNMADFVERFQLEQLDELGETIKMLGQVVVDDKHCPEDLKYSVLEFMLSVNFKAFRTARMHLKETMERRSSLLESLALAYKQRELAKKSLSNGPTSVRRPLDLEIEVSSIGNSSLSDSLNLSLDLSLDCKSLDSVDSPTEQQQVLPDGEGAGRQDTPEELDAIKRFSHALFQLRQEQLNRDKDSDASLGLNKPHPFGSFAMSFAHYLRRQQQYEGEEGQGPGQEERVLLRELLTMFFQPDDCRHFQLVDHLIQGRPNVACHNLLQQFLRPLQQMQLLQLFIECHDENHLETLTSLTAAFRRLLKPVVESLTHFEQRVASGKEQAALRALLHATKQSFQRLQLLWQLAVGSNVVQPQVATVPHLRSHRIVCKLLQLTTDKSALGGSAAALLLHVLQVHCQFLDSWWQLGEFQDCLDEFLAKRLEAKGHSEYVMREVDKLENCSLYQILKQHIKSAGHSLAVLYDSQRLSDFVAIHHALLKKPLHYTLVKCVLHQLQTYQVESVRKVSAAPDIFKQLKSAEDEQMRSLYYAYYKESLPDFKQPLICGIDELLKQCQSCASYTPFQEIICRCLERVLEPRVLLVNAFVLHLLRVQLQLDKVLAQLRSVYLLHNFRLFEQQFEIALVQLQLGLVAVATEQLQGILNSHNPRQGHQFRVSLASADLGQLSLHYCCDPALICIINESHLKVYNSAFRRLLQVHLAIRKLQQLPELACNPVAVASLINLKTDLELALEQHMKTEQLQQAAAQCDDELQRCLNLPQLQQLHNAYVQQMSDILQAVINMDSNLQELLMLATVLAKHWLRLQQVLAESSKCGKLEEFEAQYAQQSKSYLLSIHRLSESMQCLLAWPTAEDQGDK
ncbi:hypothetical protein ACLKA6_005124 [Drosophila palustris]